MRLTCPNCDAQYEVPDEVVPTDGRDVQCSNCGQTWFQYHPDFMPDEDEADAPDAAEEIAKDLDTPDPDEEVAPPPPPIPPGGPEPQKRQLDPAVADILRQEAEAEHEARKRRRQADQDPLESQPDLGLQEGASDSEAAFTDSDAIDDDTLKSEARNRMARMRGEPIPAAAAVGSARVSSRRELLPDIEEINSTLRSEDTSDRATGAGEDAEDAAPRRRGGFGKGFMLIVLLFILAALLYVLAPQISASVPALEPTMSAYITWVDGLRVWLDTQLQSMGSWLDDKAAESSN